jgi:hypothetical protein
MSVAFGETWAALTRQPARLVGTRTRASAQPTAPDLAHTLQAHHQEWEPTRVFSGLLAWLIFYAIAIIGSLSGTNPAAVTPEMSAAVAVTSQPSAQ